MVKPAFLKFHTLNSYALTSYHVENKARRRYTKKLKTVCKKITILYLLYYALSRLYVMLTSYIILNIKAKWLGPVHDLHMAHNGSTISVPLTKDLHRVSKAYLNIYDLFSILHNLKMYPLSIYRTV